MTRALLDNIARLARVAALAGGATLCAALCAALVRTALLGRRRQAPPSLAAEASSTSALAPANLAAHFISNKAALASRLARALSLRTIAYEDSDGNAASLLPNIGAAPAAAPAGGCLCCREALSGDSEQERDARTSPTPAALDESRAAFLKLHDLLSTSFPRLHASLERHRVNIYSLVFIWRPREGTQPVPGVALCAHMDVVPVPDAPLWKHPPFGGVVADGFVPLAALRGRGRSPAGRRPADGGRRRRAQRLRRRLHGAALDRAPGPRPGSGSGLRNSGRRCEPNLAERDNCYRNSGGRALGSAGASAGPTRARNSARPQHLATDSPLTEGRLILVVDAGDDAVGRGSRCFLCQSIVCTRSI